MKSFIEVLHMNPLSASWHIFLSMFEHFLVLLLKWGGVGKSIKKRQIVAKVFFQVIFNEVLKSCKKYLLVYKLM